jgi:BlaI family transcriptional regulator, penicillinase repressor
MEVNMAKSERVPRPTDGELAILRVLWDGGPATVRQVHEKLGRETAYTTVLKLMQIMTEKGLVRRNEEEHAHVYTAVCSEGATQRQLVRNLLDKAFAGSAGALVLQALAARRATEEELRQIRELLDEHEKQGRKEAGD